ncbi:MAG: hypothetical protein J0G96_11130 [Flavobacteriia bacterium]|nr:hypothetical protein [Flavobacteriia bacterium]OJX37615.1 MAG: hypothetical protein BGO87_11105 [Flavobacteriia bacterium 40-80]
MNTINRINIQKIEFGSNTEYVNVFCRINSNEFESDSQMIVEQKILNRIICKIQAAQMDDEVLNYLESKNIDPDNTIYTLNLEETSYQNTWIELDEQIANYHLIRA